MQGRQEPGGKRNDPLDRSATSGYRFAEEAAKYRRTDGTGAYRFSDLTGRQPVVPKRPPGMSPHLDIPPPTPRVARPQQVKAKRKTWRWWTGALVVFLVGSVLLLLVAYGAVNFFFATNATLGPATAASNFLADLQNADYDQAYTLLDPTLTGQLGSSDFKKMAQADDRCYGQVTDYQEINDSAKMSADQNTQSFAYTITRSKLSKTYQMTLTLQRYSSDKWDVSSYGDDLGPAPPTCS